jgi:hypothetical protein
MIRLPKVAVGTRGAESVRQPSLQRGFIPRRIVHVAGRRVEADEVTGELDDGITAPPDLGAHGLLPARQGHEAARYAGTPGTLTDASRQVSDFRETQRNASAFTRKRN